LRNDNSDDSLEYDESEYGDAKTIRNTTTAKTTIIAAPMRMTGNDDTLAIAIQKTTVVLPTKMMETPKQQAIE